MRERQDLLRQVVVAASAVFAVVGSAIGSGAAGGTPIQDAAGGALSATATLIAPATPAFSIWAVIYLGLIAYAVWQLLPRQSAAPRHRRLGYWIAASLVLNAVWILSVQAGLLWVSLLVIAALLVVLCRAFIICVQLPPRGGLDSLITDGTIGLYLGWVSIATAANATAVFAAAGFTGFGMNPQGWSVAVIGVAGLVGVLAAFASRGRIAPAISLCWGLTWVAIARLTGEPLSTPTAVAAIVAASLVLLATLIIRFASRKASL